ncbi:MAG: ankyrin repeat domain-containing protein [Acidobacteria bacterium]|nr:ankyrin repeat domain-containing protein [Acidobacteriota bacterium]
MTEGTEMVEAAKAGNADAVRKLLAEDAALASVRLPTGETPLMAALYRGHVRLAELLADAVEKGSNLDLFAAAAMGRLDALNAALVRDPGSITARAYDGWTALHLAAFFGRREAVERLLSAGADIQAVADNSIHNTPLHAAVAGGHVDVSLLLIERGADVNAVDAGGYTPLHIAAEAGYAPVVQALLARDADPHAVDAEDKTPLSRAAARNHAEIVDLINTKPL